MMIKYLLSNHYLFAIFGWALFPGMYVAVGLLTQTSIEVPKAFSLASPLGVLGFISWILAAALSFRKSVWRETRVKTIVALLLSVPPLIFLAFGYWVATNGGV